MTENRILPGLFYNPKYDIISLYFFVIYIFEFVFLREDFICFNVEQSVFHSHSLCFFE